MARKAAEIGKSIAEQFFAADNLCNQEIAGQQFIGLKKPHPDAPKQRPYRFNDEQVRDLHIALAERMNVLLTGPTGCGKTSLPIALAAELGRPVVRFNCNGETRVSSLVGMQKPAAKDGVLTLQFSPAGLVRAMRGGYWVIMDEIDAATPSVLMVMQTVLEEDNPTLYIPETDETISDQTGLHPEFRIIATGNTLGYRAASRARHAGTNVMNQAFVDRFGMVIACDYPDRIEEIERVQKHVETIDHDDLDGICRVAEQVRKDNKFRADFSTRRLIQWARLVPHYEGDVLIAAERAVVRKLELATDAKIAREVIRRIFQYPEGA